MKLDSKNIFILDGPTGTEIDRRGGDTSAPLWSARVLFDNPELVYEIHSDYIKAGVDIITTNTFRTQPWTLQKEGISEAKAREITLLAVDLALQSRKKFGQCLVAGSIPPLEDCYSPWLVPKDNIIATEQQKHIKNLVDGGIDIFLIETMNTLREAKITYELTKEYPDIPVIVSFTTDDQGKVLGGDEWDSITNVFKEEIAVLSINCSSVSGSDKALQELIKLGVNNFGVYPNFGRVEKTIWIRDNHNEEVHEYLYKWLTFQPKLIGTCCGAYPSDSVLLKENVLKLVEQK